MEERRFLPAQRIQRRLSDTFLPVAGRATEAQVVGSCPALSRQRYDVVDLKSHTQQRLCAATVGAEAAGLAQYLPTGLPGCTGSLKQLPRLLGQVQGVLGAGLQQADLIHLGQ